MPKNTHFTYLACLLLSSLGILTDMLTLEKTGRETEAPMDLEESTTELVFPMGLLGFESNKRFRLISPSDIAPYQLLEGLDGTPLSFLVIPSTYAATDYPVDLSDEDAAALGLRSPDDAVMINIATCRKDGTVMVNLKGPIVYHRDTLIARQVVPNNAIDLPLTHLLKS